MILYCEQKKGGGRDGKNDTVSFALWTWCMNLRRETKDFIFS